MNMSSIDTAQTANSAHAWDALWKREGSESWRKTVMATTYDRIETLIPKKAKVLDIGGGIGFLASRLAERGNFVQVWDISPHAIQAVRDIGIQGRVVDLEKSCPEIPVGTWVVATEILEHLSEKARSRLLQAIQKAGGKALLSVPNDRLGPDEEPQHTIKWTAVTFRKYLESMQTRVEVLGPPADPHGDPAFLLAVCGLPLPKEPMALTLPVRDEGKDLGRVLASFRGSASEIVVGIDPRTKDNTWAVAERYADKIFTLVDPEGPVPGNKYEGPRCQKMAQAKESRVPTGGVHFAWVRNQCLDMCESPWIFMTEGHESLAEGQDNLRYLDQLPNAAQVVMVWRSDGHNQRWGFPWLHRNNPKIAYERSTHNSLDFPQSYLVVKLPKVRTLHERDHHRSVERAAQRKVQNRISLMDDWMKRGSEFSKYYLASEWREFDNKRALSHFQELLAIKNGSGPMRYQARLILAKLQAGEGKVEDCRATLLGCTTEDWSRTEHWIWLGDLAAQRGNWEEASQFYLYGASRLNNPPFTCWWIDMSFYSYLPAQRLAMAYGELGDAESSLQWAKVVKVQLPLGAPQELHDEADMNISQLHAILKGDTDHEDVS